MGGYSSQELCSSDIERDVYKQQFSVATNLHKVHVRFQGRVEIFNTTVIISGLTLISDFIGK